MKQEDKKLLLKDLCCRLPYGVKVNYNEEVCIIDSIGNDSELLLKNNDGEIVPKWEDSLFISIEKCKPYLFPISNMTEEQYESLKGSGILSNCSHSYEYFIPHIHGVSFIFKEFKTYSLELIEWLNKNHFDYRGLIEKGLAIDATGLNIY